MAYVVGNPKTKKELKTRLAIGAEHVKVFQPGLGTVPMNGPIALEGPHYPQPHTWYAVGLMKDGRLIAVQ